MSLITFRLKRFNFLFLTRKSSLISELLALIWEISRKRLRLKIQQGGDNKNTKKTLPSSANKVGFFCVSLDDA